MVFNMLKTILIVEGIIRFCGRLKVGLSLSKRVRFICFNEKPLKMTNTAYYIMLKALFVLKIFKFLSQLF